MAKRASVHIEISRAAQHVFYNLNRIPTIYGWNTPLHNHVQRTALKPLTAQCVLDKLVPTNMQTMMYGQAKR